MKKLIICILALSIFKIATIFSQGNTKIITPKITHVTVFSSGAQINSVSEISVSQGTNTFLIRGLSPYIENQSINVKGMGKFTILSVSNQINYISGIEENSVIEDLKKKIEDLTFKNDENKMQVSILKEQESFLVANKMVGGKDTNLDVNNFKSLYDFYRSTLKQIRSEVLTIERKIAETDEEINKLKQQLNVLQSKNNLPSGEISVVVRADNATTGKLELNYLVQNAGWNPSYDIRVSKINNPVSLVYKANVFQNTGIDWNNVILTFSSANPNKSGNLPVIRPYYIDFIRDSGLRDYDADSRKAEQVMAFKESVIIKGAADNDLKLSGPVGFVASENATSIEFKVDLPYTIPSESKPKSIDMMFFELPAVYEYQSIPRLDKTAFLIAKIHDWEKYDLLKGQANLYFENTYVGRSVLDAGTVMDSMNLSLGRDLGIIVKRDKRKNFTSEKLIGTNKIVTLSWEISVRNSKSELTRLKVTDQIPISQNKDITIEAIELSGGKLESKTGYVTWDFELKPGETKNIILTYSAKFPRNSKVNIE